MGPYSSAKELLTSNPFKDSSTASPLSIGSNSWAKLNEKKNPKIRKIKTDDASPLIAAAERLALKTNWSQF